MGEGKEERMCDSKKGDREGSGLGKKRGIERRLEMCDAEWEGRVWGWESMMMRNRVER